MFTAFENKITQNRNECGAIGEVGCRALILEFAIAVIRGSLHPLQPFAGRQLPECGAPHKEIPGYEKKRQYRYRNDQEQHVVFG